MADTPKARLSKLRKHLVVPREVYLAAVKRQEGRAWAKWTDPGPGIEVKKRMVALKEQLGMPDDNKTVKLAPARQTDPALFDTDDEIRRDDTTINAYLAAFPTEPRRPMARGRTHAEIFEYWKKSAEGRAVIEQFQSNILAALEKAKAKYLSGTDKCVPEA